VWQNFGMTTYVPVDRDQRSLLPPDLKEWLPEDDVAHFAVAAVSGFALAVGHPSAGWRQAAPPPPAAAGAFGLQRRQQRECQPWVI
jgi:hypothetical protein